LTILENLLLYNYNNQTKDKKMKNQVLEKIVQKNRKGFVGVRTKTLCKTRKNAPKVEKLTMFLANVGFDYTHTQAGKEAINQQGKENPLPWGEWKQFPYLIEHKGQDYLRLYPVKTSKKRVFYYVDGKSVTKDQVKDYLLKTSKVEEPACFTVRMDSILSIK
jgi:hypothetical protein